MEKKLIWNTIIDKNVYLRVNNYLLKNHKSKKTSDKNKKLENNKIEIINDDKILDNINKLLEIKNYKEINSLELLKKQEIISNYLSKYFIQNTKLNYNFVNNCITWLLEVSKMLAKRINQKINTHTKNKKNKNNISRSSYKFCSHSSQCEYNYGTKKKSCCSDHYVHTYVYADLASLKQYIETKTIVDDNFESNREITKCINTIAYVIRHMYDELRNVCLYQSEENYEKVHMNKKRKNRFNKSI